MCSDRVTVIIVTHNSAAVIGNALDSIPSDCAVICVDNASNDQTHEGLSRYPLRIVKNSENLGFGRACNCAAEMATTEFVLFLNPDAILQSDTIEIHINAADHYADAAVFSPRIENSDGKLQFRETSRIERWKRRAPRHRSVPPVGDCCTGFADGSVLFARRDFFVDFGGFDTNIFLYHEDDDLSYRLQAAKAPMIYVHGARARHLVSSSSTSSVSVLIRRGREKVTSEYYVRAKFGVPVYPIFDGLKQIPSILWYLLTLRWRQLAGAVGRLFGIIRRP